MNNFNITIDISDTLITKCKTTEKLKAITFLNSNQEEALQDGCILKVLACYTNKCLIQIKKSNFYFIRFIYLNSDTLCCFPSEDKCLEHSISLIATEITCL